MTKLVRDLCVELEQNRPNVDTLTVENSLFDVRDFPLLLQALKRNVTIKNLNLYGVRFGEIPGAYKPRRRYMQILAQKISPRNAKEDSLERLTFWKNRLDTEDMRILTEALKVSRSIKTLRFLGASGLNDETIFLLAKAVEANTSIEELQLFCEDIRDKGAVALASAIEYNTHLKRLKLVMTGIQTPGVSAIAKALGKNVTLTDLELQGNTFDKKLWDVLQERLNFNRQVTAASQGKIRGIVPPKRLTIHQKAALFRVKQKHPQIKVETAPVSLEFFRWQHARETI